MHIFFRDFEIHVMILWYQLLLCKLYHAPHIVLYLGCFVVVFVFKANTRHQFCCFAFKKKTDLRIVSSDATSLIAMRLNKIKRETEKRNTLNKSNWFEILENGIINKPGSISSGWWILKDVFPHRLNEIFHLRAPW